MRSSSPSARRAKLRVVFDDTPLTLAQVVGVDYFNPGWPPQTPDIVAVACATMKSKQLWPGAFVLGALEKGWCDERHGRRRDRHRRYLCRCPWEHLARPEERQWVPR